MNTMLKQSFDRLSAITSDCNEEMHEPDNNGISAVVDGNHLDNAFGDSGFCGEFIVTIHNEETGHIATINLATLIALARKAQL